MRLKGPRDPKATVGLRKLQEVKAEWKSRYIHHKEFDREETGEGLGVETAGN